MTSRKPTDDKAPENTPGEILFKSFMKAPSTGQLHIFSPRAFSAPLALIVLINTTLRSEAENQDDFYTKLDSLNREILLKDVELERLNIEFRKANNVQGRWRGLRYFLSQETNNVSTAVGLWTALSLREKPIHNKYLLGTNLNGKLKIRRNTPFRIGLEDSTTLQLVGQAVGAYGSAVELGINHFHDYQAKKKGLDPASATCHVRKIAAETQELLARRKALITAYSGQIPETHIQLAEEQGEVLQDLYHLALDEYVKFNISARRFRAFQDSIYMLDICKNSIAVSGNIIGLYAAAKRRPSASGPSALGTLISGAFAISNPVTARLIGEWKGSRCRRELKDLASGSEDCDLDKLKADSERLSSSLKSVRQSGGPDNFFSSIEELQASNELSTLSHRKEYELARRELRAGTIAATQNIAMGGIAGGTKVATGIGATIAGFTLYNQPVKANYLLFGCTIPYAVGSTMAAADNIRIQLQSEISRRKLAKKQMLPRQILAEHLQKLDEIERRLARKFEPEENHLLKAP